MKKIIVKGENILNLPNLISFYRLIISPVILYFLLIGEEKTFATLLTISLLSDIADGYLARRLKLQTNFGAALDNLADVCTMLLAFSGLFIFKWNEIEPHKWVLFTFFGIILISYIVSFIRFRKIPGLHLYINVVGAYVQGLFLIILFTVGFYQSLFYAAVIWGIIGYCEKTIVLFLLDDIKIGVKGLYWLLKEK